MWNEQFTGWLGDTFAGQAAVPAFREVAFERAEIPPDAKLVDETGHDAAGQRVFLRADLRLLLCFIGRAGGRDELLLRQFDNLLKSLLDQAGGLRVDAVAAAVFDIEPIIFRELICAHQRVEIGFLAVLEQFPGFANMFIVAAKAHEHIATTDERGAQRGSRDAIMFGGFDEHARVARVHR